MSEPMWPCDVIALKMSSHFAMFSAKVTTTLNRVNFFVKNIDKTRVDILKKRQKCSLKNDLLVKYKIYMKSNNK